MRKLVVLAVVLFSFSAFSHVLEDYQFPISNVYLATLSNVVARPQNYKVKAVELNFMPERSQIEFVKGRQKLDITFKLQKKPAPLVFVIAGLGGSSNTGSTLILSQLIYQLGYHAVTVPNPLSWGFSLGGSSTGLTGYAPDDVRDLYRFLKFVDQYLKSQENIKVTNYGVLGYSMGGLHTGFIQQLDKQEQYFNFKRALMINPPIDLLHGISVLDGMYTEGLQMSATRRRWVFGYLYSEGGKIYDRYLAGEPVSVLAQEFALGDRELQWLIGSAFRTSLRDMILVSQSIKDLGVLKNSWTASHREARTREAEQFSFFDYLQKIYYPNHILKDGYDISEFVYSGSLLPLMEKFKNDSSVYVMHNLDDFLLRPEDPNLMEEIFADRCLLFPRGGHVGNLWFDVNQNEIKKVLSNL